MNKKPKIALIYIYSSIFETLHIFLTSVNKTKAFIPFSEVQLNVLIDLCMIHFILNTKASLGLHIFQPPQRYIYLFLPMVSVFPEMSC